MKQATLRRIKTGDAGTFGTLEFEGHTFHTGELPDRGNADDVSCIPAGTYRCTWNMSNRFKREMYQVLDVPGRTGIRFHSANVMGDTTKGLKCELNGCIALGTGQGEIQGQQGVLGSRDAIRMFETTMAGQDFELTITDEYQEAGAIHEHVA